MSVRNSVEQESRAAAGKPRDAAVNFDIYGVCRQLFISFDTFSGSGMTAHIEYNN